MPSQLYADGANHSFVHDGLEPVVWQAVEWARTVALDEPSAMVTSVNNVIDAYDDVISRDQDYQDDNVTNHCWEDCTDGYGRAFNPWAWTECFSRSGTGNPAAMCQQWLVRYDLSDLLPATVEERRWIACHEIAHTVGFADPPPGLQDPASSCTYDRREPNTPSLLSVHDLEHINARYTHQTSDGGTCQIGGGIAFGVPGDMVASAMMEMAICPAPDPRLFTPGFQ